MSRVTKYFQSLPDVPACDRPEGCATCPFTKLKVGSRGPIDSPFVIVGESPGSQELSKGYPFIGPSGEMLEDVLKQAGIYDAGMEPYFTNALQCMPAPHQKNIPTMGPAVSGCQGRLYKELAAYPRKVILALGASASWSLTNDFGLKITQDRGRLYEHPLAEVGVVTAVHPAFLMRNGSGYPLWKKDVTYSCNLAMGQPTPERWTPPEWGVIETRDQLQGLVDKYRNAKEITADTETGGTDAHGIPNGLDYQRGYVLSLGVTSDLEDGQYVHIIPGDVIWANEDLARELFGLPAKWVWQNGKFDIKFFRFEGIPEARVDEDLMLLSYALNENKGHDLDTIAWDYLKAPKHKDAISNWFKSQGIPRSKWDYALVPRMEVLYPYQAIDISKTHQAYYVLKELVEADRNSKKQYNDLLIPGTEFLANVEMAGLTLDPERVAENKITLMQRREEIEKKIQPYALKHLGTQINVASPAQLKKLLYQRMKLNPDPNASTDEDALIMIQRKHDHPIAGYLLQWREISKQLNTYVRPALDRWEPKSSGSKKLVFKRGWGSPDGKVHCDFGLHKTSTGRLGSSDPNMQNIPRDPLIRGQFVARPGRTLIELDLNQAELRVLAIMSGDRTLIDIYTKNEVSIHHITSVAMFGEHYTDDEKMRAKAVNFGIVYGRQPPSLAEEFDISVKEATEYIRIWLARYPEAAKFIQWCRDQPHHQKTMINKFGQKKRWGLVSPDNRNAMENEAANWPCQSTAHAITLRSGIIVQPVLKQKWDIDIVNEIHDALYLEAEDDPAIYMPASKYVQSVMQKVPTDYGLTLVPFLAEAKKGNRWGRDYMKGLDLDSWKEAA